MFSQTVFGWGVRVRAVECVSVTYFTRIIISIFFCLIFFVINLTRGTLEDQMWRLKGLISTLLFSVGGLF